MKAMVNNRRTRADAGFSLVELLAVVGIISLMLAISIPAISSYIKNYRIRGAASQVMGEFQTARARAIKRNATLGVILVIVSPTSYRYVIEDQMDPTLPFTAVRKNVSVLLTSPGCATGSQCAQAGPIKLLPPDVVFRTTGATVNGLRFNHLGAACNPGASGDCPNSVDVGVAQILPSGTDWLVTVASITTGLTRNVRISPGGRISTE
ncbi:MAG: Tfp pilus assembly protein FimT/FimU [Vicinamibacteria bacterium]